MHTLQQLQSGELAGATHIRLSCKLKTIPPELFALADTLQQLDLSGNELTYLPPEFARFKKLRILFLSDNQFTTFPSVLKNCIHLDIVGFKANQIDTIEENSIPINLRWLILTNNKITSLPRSIGNCSRLQKVMLAGNQLTQLPDEMKACRQLELLRISANYFHHLPVWLFSLPRLSWLAYASNPCSETAHMHEQFTDVPWDHLLMEEVLGEGASGVITKAQWINTATAVEVAVKIFKGEVTSDGLPTDEMKACMAAGSHPHLVRVLARISHHPQTKQGLIFNLIPPDFKNLGGPPDFITCTRDTYAKETSFSLQSTLRIASGIANAAAHLHARGITHGDLYAHNILIDQQAHPLLGDFGAATFYNSASEESGLLQRLEVRAFGCLLDDLLTRTITTDKCHPVFTTLIQIGNACMQEEVLMRPDFNFIHYQLANLTV